MRRRLATAAFVAAVVFLPVAWAQSDIPSVGVVPTESRPDDPNRGQWFVFELAPGQTGTTRARITNPADVPQRVKLYFADLVFAADGTPSIREGEQQEVGLWGRFAVPEALVPAKGEVIAEFSVTPDPRTADPGDHVGVVVAESEPQGAGAVKIVKRVATRLYVTVPGDAIRAFEIEKVARKLDSRWFPGQASATVFLRNTGRVRLRPAVTLNGAVAQGPSLLLSASVEQYLAGVRVPWYGGPVRLNVQAVTEDGQIRRVSVSMFVIPWGLLIVLALLSTAAAIGVRWWRRRRSRVARLQADIRRLEQLIVQRPGVPVTVTAGDGGPGDEGPDEAGALLAAMKRARRTESWPAFSRLVLALHDARGDALDELLEAIEKGPRSDALTEAALSYGDEALSAHPRLGRLPPEVVEKLVPGPPPGLPPTVRRRRR